MSFGGGGLPPSQDRFTVVRCKHCGLVYLNPRPPVEDIAQYYPAGKYYTHRPYRGWSACKETLKRFLRQSMPGYSKGTTLGRFLIGKCLAPILTRHMNIFVPFRSQGRILDVGCGNGEMVAWMRDYGWETHGTDISPHACAEAARRGLSVRCGLLEEIAYPEASFDVITMGHVLEHSHDPLALLNECRRILNDDGQLIVSVPNFGCIDRELYGPSWWQIDTPRHLYHFTQATLGSVLDCAGFRVLQWKFKLPLPFVDRTSIRRIKETGIGTMERYWLATSGCLRKLVAAKEHTSFDLTAYAVKSGCCQTET